MRKSKLIVAMLSLLLVNQFALAQEKLWETDLKDLLYNVSWVLQSNNGYLIAAGDKGLAALDNNSGEVVWHNENLKAVSKESFQNIPGLPLVVAEYSNLVGKTSGMIINAATGKVLYDSKEEGYKVKTYHIMAEQGTILFELANADGRAIMSFSLKTWEPIWTINIGKVKGLAAKLKSVGGVGFIEHGPSVTKAGNLVLGLQSEIIVVDPAAGKVLWQQETDKNIKALVYSDLNNSLYLGIKGDKKLTVFNPATGEDITPGKLKLKGTLLDIRDDGRGRLVLVETAGFNLIDPKSGELIWKKSYTIDYLDEVIPYKEGYIAIGKDFKNGSISLVSNDGDKIWDAKTKGYSYFVTPTKAGVMYVSTERSNILDYSNGKDVWDKDVKFKSLPAVTFDEESNKIILFENGRGFKFDNETGKIEEFATEVELMEVDKKTPLVAEVVASGYFLSTDQHASVLSKDGKVVYTKYFEPVTSTNFMSLAQAGLSMAGVDLDIAGSIENLKALDAISKGAYQSGGDDNGGTSSTSVISGLYVGSEGNMATVFEVTKTRYSNSKATKERKYILAQQKGGDGSKMNVIVVLDKASGEELYQIALLDKTPNYEVDTIDDRVFINQNNHLITAYQIK